MLRSFMKCWRQVKLSVKSICLIEFFFFAYVNGFACSGNDFCKDYLNVATNNNNNKTNRGFFAIKKDSLRISRGEEEFFLSGNIVFQNPLPNNITYTFELYILENNSLRIRIKDNDINRTIGSNETRKQLFNPNGFEYLKEKQIKTRINDKYVQINYGENEMYSYLISYSPFRIDGYYRKNLTINVNWNNHMIYNNANSSLNNKFESVGMDFQFNKINNVYGIPEHLDQFNLQDTNSNKDPYHLYNTDMFNIFDKPKNPMYGSVPFLMGVLKNYSLGVFWINSAETIVNIDKKSNKTVVHFLSETGEIDFIMFMADKPSDINKDFGSVIGYTLLPPLFSLGYHLSRWNYNNEFDFNDVDSLMDHHYIPYDAFWLDIEYTIDRNFFSWNKELFPDPKRLLFKLNRLKRNLIIILDPQFEIKSNITDFLIYNDLYVKKRDNEMFVGECWAGKCIWPDVFNPQFQKFYNHLFSHYYLSELMCKNLTNLHFWNDMNEPSIFNVVDSTFYKDNQFYNGIFDKSVHNLYGMLFHKATYDASLLILKGKIRPFVLSRSFFVGSQRIGPSWLGDNKSDWFLLRISIPMLLSLNVANMPFSGADVGGFIGDPSVELLIRWYQTAIWYPFFRVHLIDYAKRREIWLFPNESFIIMRDAIRLRYLLLSVLYSLFYESSITALPIIKPLFYESQEDEKVYSIDDQFFWGNSGLMIKPIMENSATHVDVYFPDTQIYYYFDNGKILSTKEDVKTVKYLSPSFHQLKNILLYDIPIYLKGGHSIFVKEKYRRSSKLMFYDPFSLIVALDNNLESKGQNYLDDGESFEFKNHNQYLISKIIYKNNYLNYYVEIKNSSFIQKIQNIKIHKIVLLSPHSFSDDVLVISHQSNTKKSLDYSVFGNKIIIYNLNFDINRNYTIMLSKKKNHDEL